MTVVTSKYFMQNGFDYDGQECWYKGHLVSVYFDRNGRRAGCDYAIEVGNPNTVRADLHFLPIPDDIRLATLAWSETSYRHTMPLGEFLEKMLGE